MHGTRRSAHREPAFSVAEAVMPGFTHTIAELQAMIYHYRCVDDVPAAQ